MAHIRLQPERSLIHIGFESFFISRTDQFYDTIMKNEPHGYKGINAQSFYSSGPPDSD
jgi:hypothetical protein